MKKHQLDEYKYLISLSTDEAKSYILKQRDSTSKKRSVAKFLEEKTTFLNDDAKYQERVYCFLNDIKEQLLCPYTKNKLYFKETSYIKNQGYSSVCKELHFWVKEDSKISSLFLKNEHFIKLGMHPDKLPFDKKNLNRIRNYFKNCKNIQDIKNRLKEDRFTEDKIKELTNNLILDNADNLITFLNKIIAIRKNRNHSLQFFTERGHSVNDSKELLKIFFRRGMEAIQEKRLISPEYNEMFIESRRNGKMAANKVSKMEKQIFDLLSKNYKVVGNKETIVIKNTRLFKKYGQRSFKHDYFFDNIVIEYNGTYWHKDKTFEIEKAYYCLNHTSTNKYILLWEGDFKTAEQYLSFIEDCMDDKKTFYSTRRQDVQDYYLLKHTIVDQVKWDKKFLSIAESFSEMSKCQSKNVAAIATIDRRIVCTGLNGSIPHAMNCSDIFKNGVNEENREKHHRWSQDHEIHAEMNLILHMAKMGEYSIKNATIYVNLEPCNRCLLSLITCGVERVVFSKRYDKIDRKVQEQLLHNSSILFDYIEI